METNQFFYSLYEITLTQKVIENIYPYLEEAVEESIIFTYDCLTNIESRRLSSKDDDEAKYSFPENFKDPFFKDVKDQVLFFNNLRIFWEEINMRDFYIFRYKTRLFVLLVGETILVSNWHRTISQTFNQIINEIKITDKIENRVNNFDLKDYTFSEAEDSTSSKKKEEIKPRRLRSLGGSLRRLFFKIKKNGKPLTKKKIMEDLVHFVVSGDEHKLLTQISAVENNTRVDYLIKAKDIILNYLPIDPSFTIIEEKVYQPLKEGTDNEKKELMRKIDNFFTKIQELVNNNKKSNQLERWHS